MNESFEPSTSDPCCNLGHHNTPSEDDHLIDYYDILGVAKTASLQEIRAAYFHLKSTFNHQNQALYAFISEEEAAQMQHQTEEAYQVLSNESKRKEHNHRLAERGILDASFFLLQSTSFSGRESSRSEEAKNYLASLGELATQLIGDGKLFKELRTNAKISLEQMQEHIKVPMDTITNIEENRFERLPQAVYVKGFLKSYCRFLGIGSSDHLIDAYMVRYRECSATDN